MTLANDRIRTLIMYVGVRVSYELNKWDKSNFTDKPISYKRPKKETVQTRDLESCLQIILSLFLNI